ncbi:alpha/beta hydrolase [Thalassotalea sediminis]|uniref:alpha/beta hydrolase n=1 Tax=Thalassotalea sediminis TaxID=1759089 RepID=UPI0025739A66|nr:alpha/beta hydrolase [Thalassotalea sediminis]
MTNTVYRNFSLPALEQEYSPSSCVQDINKYIAQYIEQSAKNKDIARNNHAIIENIQYGNTAEEILDLFLPYNLHSADSESTHKKKLHIFIHGGYWQELSKDESCFAAANFQHHGYHFAAINYTLAPKASLTEILSQVRTAIAWLYQHADEYGYDPQEIYLSGSSAGAQLAIMAAMTDWQAAFGFNKNIVRGVCAVSGIYDLTPIQYTYINEPLQLTPEEIKNLSPLLANRKLTYCSDTSFIIAYGENETLEFKRQSNDLYHLNLLGRHKLLIENIAEKNHFDVILDLSDENSTLFESVLNQMESRF